MCSCGLSVEHAHTTMPQEQEPYLAESHQNKIKTQKLPKVGTPSLGDVVERELKFIQFYDRSEEYQQRTRNLTPLHLSKSWPLATRTIRVYKVFRVDRIIIE